jgi:uncharacterized protein YecT (DUF1311 family)
MEVPCTSCYLSSRAGTEYGSVLSNRYQQAIKLSPKISEPLQESQRNWLKFQDLNCKLHRMQTMDQGVAEARVSLARCLLLTTIERKMELKQMTDEH